MYSAHIAGHTASVRWQSLTVSLTASRSKRLHPPVRLEDGGVRLDSLQIVKAGRRAATVRPTSDTTARIPSTWRAEGYRLR